MIQLDVRGRNCPVPILMCTRKLREMAIGEAMEVLADDPLFASDVRAWCGHSGHVLRSFEQKADHCVAVVERGR